MYEDIDILYLSWREYANARWEAVDKHLSEDYDTAYIPLRGDSRGSIDSIREVEVDVLGNVDENVRMIDPEVVLVNVDRPIEVHDFHEDYTTIYTGHGCNLRNLGNKEWEFKLEKKISNADMALMAAEHNSDMFREVLDIPVMTVGMPECDYLPDTEPNEGQYLFAPTSHCAGRGAYMNVGKELIRKFEDNPDKELIFSPHPFDRPDGGQDPESKKYTKECREMISDIDNITFATDMSWEAHSNRLATSEVLLSDFSGSIACFMHTGRKIIQFGNIVRDTTVPHIGHVTDDVDSIFDIDEFDDWEWEMTVRPTRDKLGLPVDGKASERFAKHVEGSL